MSGSMITTFKYELGVGVTSMTDARGYTTNYTYDEYNRLEEVRDEDDQLRSDYKYHYKGQQ